MVGEYRDDGNEWRIQEWRSDNQAYTDVKYCSGRAAAIKTAFESLEKNPKANLRAICNGNFGSPIATIHCIDRLTGFVDFVPVECVLGKDLFDYKCPQRECFYADGKYEVKQVNDYVFELKSVA